MLRESTCFENANAEESRFCCRNVRSGNLSKLFSRVMDFKRAHAIAGVAQHHRNQQQQP